MSVGTAGRGPRRRSVAGGAWALPVLAVSASAPAFAASALFNGEWQFAVFIDGPEVLLWADSASPFTQGLPAGYEFQLTFKYNTAGNDAVTIADYRSQGLQLISSSSSDGTTPSYGGGDTISQNETWTFRLRTTVAVPRGQSLPIFDIYDAARGSNWTLTAQTLSADGKASDNFLAWTATLPNNNPVYYPTTGVGRSAAPATRPRS